MAASHYLVFYFATVLLQVTFAMPIQELCNDANRQIIATLGPPTITSATFTPMPNSGNGILSELVPNLQVGDVSLSGDLPIGGTIRVSGCFPVYGLVAVEGSVPSSGSAVVNTGCQFNAQTVNNCP